MASPHKNGNTSTLLQYFLDGIQGEYEIVNAYDMNVAPCIDCKYCKSNKLQCAIKDDMQKIYEKINNSDVIILASPMYFISFPAPMKNIIDRLQVYWSYKYVLNGKIHQNKTGVLLVTAGAAWENMFNNIEKTGEIFFKSVGGKLEYKLFINNTDNLPVKENKQLKNSAYDLGKKLMEDYNNRRKLPH